LRAKKKKGFSWAPGNQFWKRAQHNFTRICGPPGSPPNPRGANPGPPWSKQASGAHGYLSTKKGIWLPPGTCHWGTSTARAVALFELGGDKGRKIQGPLTLTWALLQRGKFHWGRLAPSGGKPKPSAPRRGCPTRRVSQERKPQGRPKNRAPNCWSGTGRCRIHQKRFGGGPPGGPTGKGEGNVPLGKNPRISSARGFLERGGGTSSGK